MSQDKDYSLQRPFDLERAKAGEPICEKDGEIVEFVAPGGIDGEHCIRFKERKNQVGNLTLWLADVLRMAPLCWVEGRPVYKGDVLYSKWFAETQNTNGRFVAGSFIEGYLYAPEIGARANTLAESCTWTPPAPTKVKKEGWVNIYPDYIVSPLHRTKHDADRLCEKMRVACIHIEWEE